MGNPLITAFWLSLVFLAFSGPSMAAGEATHPTRQTGSTEEASNAKATVREAANVVEQLRANPETRDALKRAKAVFIVPDYGRAALGIGGAGGLGVLIANNHGTWSGPAFYDTGSITLGLEAGVSSGSVAFLLMNDKALDGFRHKNNFSLSADAGLTVVNWSHRAQVSTGKGADVIAWSTAKGLYGDLAVGATDIFWNGKANKAYYQKTASADEIINGEVKPPEASELQSEFSALESGQPSSPQKN